MKKCQKCKTPIDDQYTMCSSCNDEYSNEIAIRQKESKEEEQTVNFYKLFLIYKFVKHNTVVLSFIDKYKHIANRIIDETKHMGFVQDKRYEEITKTNNIISKTRVQALYSGSGTSISSFCLSCCRDGF